MKIVVISTNAGTDMGGEAIKAFQFFRFLLENDYDAYLLTHERCKASLEGHFADDRVIFVRDSALMVLCWRSRILGSLVDTLFHLEIKKICRDFDPTITILHYLCPISPTTQRFPPAGYRHVVGPLSGNIFFPSGFSDRQSKGKRVQQRFYKPIQNFLGSTLGIMKKADKLLVSGGERTRRALGWAGCDRGKMISVADAGISEEILSAPPITHEGWNGEFVWIGRMVNYKGADLAIRAVAVSEQPVKLTIYGEGSEGAKLVELAESLGIADRVTFPGWLDHSSYVKDMSRFRGFIFPTLAEANGIVMQEAMGLGLPVVTLRWGGPVQLATDEEAIFVEASDPDTVVRGVARAMDQLSSDASFAQKISQKARSRALRDYAWPTVASSWMSAYEGLLNTD
ncbi:glycosyltransferase family 4 protein [Ruegeria arenilitoris]|uniref:glycosyltransferase family 4 protein n=1 Tax=Ruegeria arenilitoris TaxID=1173585 RepID=UPI00147B4F85|nr:glycosyltransferase family 4 protein [Ruegeria arenilitoris]